MPKVTIKRDNATFEISDLSLDQIKELAGLNGHMPSGKARRNRSPKNDSSYLFHVTNGEPDYKRFSLLIGEKGRKFFAILRQNPNGISGEFLAEKLEFSEPNQIGGLTGANLGRRAKQFNIDLSLLYLKDRQKLDTGAWRTTYKPGPEIAKIQ